MYEGDVAGGVGGDERERVHNMGTWALELFLQKYNNA